MLPLNKCSLGPRSRSLSFFDIVRLLRRVINGRSALRHVSSAFIGVVSHREYYFAWQGIATSTIPNNGNNLACVMAGMFHVRKSCLKNSWCISDFVAGLEINDSHHVLF